ncbi:MAG: hypothetical protein EOP06_00600 [Proteobacteria bacterium]|nr:MAG: hypothetical protein EOP06_00600 [Pseudomonadota bacterium]
MKFVQRLFILLTLVTAFLACSKKGSVNELYKFPSTKDVLVLVNIDFTADANTSGGIDLTGKNFVLNAYALDAADKQVDIGLPSGTPVSNLPVTLTGAHTSFEAILRLPVEVQPRSNGYALRFELKQPTASLVLATPPSSLDALRSEIKAGTAASTNNVDLSLASSLAYKFLSASVANVGTAPSLGSYTELVALFKAKQQSVEAGVDVNVAHDIDSYVSAILAGVNYQILTDSNFQKSVAEKLLLAVSSVGTDAQKAQASEKLAEGFTATLISLTTQVTEALGDVSSATSKVFSGNFIDTASLPEPAAYGNAVFAPIAISFTDSDTSAALGGDITITSPILSTGVASYNVYFGGEDKATAKTLLVGNVAASKSPLSLTLPAGTVQPSAVTRFWAYPVSNQAELNIPASVGIDNVGGTNLAPQAPTGLAAANSGTTNTVTWSPVTGAQSYNLYWSTTSPVRDTSNRIRNVTSPFPHKSLLLGVTYYYAVTAVKDGIESPLSSGASATPSASGSTGVTISAPLSVSATAENARNRIQWATSVGADSYNLYWSTTSPVTKSSTKISGASSAYLHQGLSNATTYYYAITAVSGSKESALSEEKSATPVGLPLIQSGLKLPFTNCPVDFSSLKISNQGDIYVVGSTLCDLPADSIATFQSGVLIKFDGNGEMKWIKQIVDKSGNQDYETSASSIALDPDGNLFVSGGTDGDVINQTSSTGDDAFWMARYDQNGNQIWIRQEGAPGSDAESNGIAVDKAGKVYVIGTSDDQLNLGPLHPVSSGDTAGFIYQLDAATGVTNWIHVPSLDSSQSYHYYESVFVSGDNNTLFVAGNSDGDFAGGAQSGASVFVESLNVSSNVHTQNWLSQSLDGSSEPVGISSLRWSAADNRIVVAGGGRIDIINGGDDTDQNIFFWALNLNGTTANLHMIRSEGTDLSRMEILPDGSYLIGAFSSDSFLSTQIGAADALLARYDTQGNLLWSQRLGRASYYTATGGMGIDSSGHIVVGIDAEANLITGEPGIPYPGGGYYYSGYLWRFTQDGVAL